jgi:hypothetical protein
MSRDASQMAGEIVQHLAGLVDHASLLVLVPRLSEQELNLVTPCITRQYVRLEVRFACLG